jgi:hypothetical protein
LYFSSIVAASYCLAAALLENDDSQNLSSKKIWETRCKRERTAGRVVPPRVRGGCRLHISARLVARCLLPKNECTV